MKTLLTNEKKRIFFQLEIDDLFKKKLADLASIDGISASGVVRMLINREHANRFDGAGPMAGAERGQGEVKP